jgi:hypothetical protein
MDRAPEGFLESSILLEIGADGVTLSRMRHTMRNYQLPRLNSRSRL